MNLSLFGPSFKQKYVTQKNGYLNWVDCNIFIFILFWVYTQNMGTVSGLIL